MNLPTQHTVVPAAGAAVSCALSFDLHTFLGYAGQVVGICSGTLSILWVVYQMRRNRK